MSNKSAMEMELRSSLQQAIGLDLSDVSAKDVALLAQEYCKLSFDPEATYKKAYLIADKVDKEEMKDEKGSAKAVADEKETAQAVAKAAPLILKATAEFDAQEDQLEVKKKLADCYKDGSIEMGIAPDPHLEHKYSGRTEGGPDAKDYKSQDVYDKSLVYTRWRLFLLRAHRFLNNYGFGFLANPLVGKAFSFLGLSYLAELGFDLFMIGRTAWKAPKGEGWARAKMAYLKDDRPYRMDNAGWWSWNLATIIDPTLSPFINLILFVRDEIADIVKLLHHRWRANKLLDIFKKRTDKLERDIELAKLDGEVPSELIAALEKSRLLESSTRQHRKGIYQKRGYLLFITTLLLIGMTFILVPQIFPAIVLSGVLAKIGPSLIAKIGAGLAWAGSIIGGAGKGIVYEKWILPRWQKLKKDRGWWKKPEAPAIEMVPREVHHANTTTHNHILRLVSYKNLRLDTSNHSPDLPEIPTAPLTPKDIKDAAQSGRAQLKFYKSSENPLPKPSLKKVVTESNSFLLKRTVSTPNLQEHIPSRLHLLHAKSAPATPATSLAQFPLPHSESNAGVRILDNGQPRTPKAAFVR